MHINTENLKGFTSHFASEFVVPQIDYWQSSIDPKVKIGSGLMEEYYDSMREAVEDVKRKFTPPFRPNSFFHDIVITDEEVEILKGIIGDNYIFLKNKIEKKKQLGVSFMKSLEEETRLRDIELYITQIIPSFDDIRKKRLWIPFEEIQLRDKAQETLFKKIENEEYDVFISHATEDKESFVEGLALTLKESGLNVWYDNFQLQWGDNLRSSIEDGLKNSKYGIVVLSKSFLGKKKWTEHELDGLFARERLDKKIILPIWHNVSRDDILAYSPTLADRLAKRSGDDEISEIVNELKRLTGK